MSQHSEREHYGPSRLSIAWGWTLVVVTISGTAYVAIGAESWRETIGMALGIFGVILMIGQVSGQMIERNEAQGRQERRAAAQRLADEESVALTRPVEQDEDDETRRLLVPQMYPGGPVLSSPRRVEDQLRVGMRFRTEAERQAWMDAPTEVMRWRGGAPRTGGPGWDSGGSTAGGVAGSC